METKEGTAHANQENSPSLPATGVKPLEVMRFGCEGFEQACEVPARRGLVRYEEQAGGIGPTRELKHVSVTPFSSRYLPR